MSSPIKKIKLIIKKITSFIRGVMLVLLSLKILYPLIKSINKSDIFIILEAGGFGHTSVTVDLARRIYPNRNITFLMFTGKGRYNEYLKCIWPKNLVIYFFPIEWTRFWYTIVPKLITKIIKNFIKDNLIVFWSLTKLHIKAMEWAPESSKEIPNYLNIRWVTGYFRIIEDTKELLAPILDRKNAEIVQKKLNLDLNKKIALFYLRRKIGDITSNSRWGSVPTDYISTFEMVINIGYIVFVTGDYIDFEKPRHLADKIYTKQNAINVGLDTDLFQMFAVSFADICITESGGGAWLPMIMKKSQLCINAYPFWYAMKNSWIYPKKIKMENGQILETSLYFSKFLYSYDLGCSNELKSNSAEEIFGAVSEFLERIKNRNPSQKDNEFKGEKVGLYETSGANILSCWYECHQK